MQPTKILWKKIINLPVVVDWIRITSVVIK